MLYNKFEIRQIFIIILSDIELNNEICNVYFYNGGEMISRNRVFYLVKFYLIICTEKYNNRCIQYNYNNSLYVSY